MARGGVTITSNFESMVKNITTDIDKAMKAAQIEIVKMTQEEYSKNFDRKGFFTGAKWPDKTIDTMFVTGTDSILESDEGNASKSYLAQKSRIGTKGTHLKDSIKSRRVGKTGVKVYSDNPVAKYNNEGTSKAPKRKFLGESKFINNRIRRIISINISRFMNRRKKTVKKRIR